MVSKAASSASSRDKLIPEHSHGTTGRATVIFHTAHDIKEWTNIVARSMYMTGMRKQDVFSEYETYGLFTGRSGVPLRVPKKIGALTIPAGAGNSRTSDSTHAGFRNHGDPYHSQLCPSSDDCF